MTITMEGCVLELRAELCPTCGRYKPSGRPFDSSCWNLLTSSARRACFARIGDGFEAAYESAKDEIRNAIEFSRSVTRRTERDRHAGYARVAHRPK